MSPKRIQLQRKKGWRKPPDAVVVSRPSIYGNPFHADIYGAERAVELYRGVFEDIKRDNPKRYEQLIAPLRGKDLCCWCKLDQVCHADILLTIATTD